MLITIIAVQALATFLVQGALAIWIRVRENITAPDVVSDEELFRRGARTLFQDLDRYFERLPLLVQRRYLQFDPCDRGD